MNPTFNKSIVFTALLILCGCQNYHSKKGVKYFHEEDYKSALFHLHKSNEIETYFENDVKIAEAYFKIDNLDSSERYYSRAHETGVNFSRSYVPYTKVLIYNEKYHHVKQLFGKNELDVYHSNEAEMLLNMCNSILLQDFEETMLYPIIKESDVNAFTLKEYRNGDAFLPEKTVYNGMKTDPWTKTTYLNLLKNDQRTIQGEWITHDLITKDKYNRFFDGPASYSQDGRTVYFTRSDYSKHDSIEKRMKVFSASFKDGRWMNLEEFEFNSDDYSVGHVALSPNDEIIYFASDMPGGFGGLDLYSCRKESGKWSTPQNLGSTINSNKNEFFPYVDANNALFYSSDQLNEEGKLDVLITYFNGDRWVKPESINYKLTSKGNDFGFTFDRYSVEPTLIATPNDRRNKSFRLTGRATDVQTEAPVQGASIQLTTGRTGELIQLYSDGNGDFNLDLENGIDYLAFLKNKNSFTKTASFSTKNTTTSADFFIRYEVEFINPNEEVTIGAIDYESENWEITLPLKNELDEIIHLLSFNPSITVEIGAHTDISGAANYNKILTEKRSHVVVQYLISQGILPARLSFSGRGEENILNECTSEKIPCTEEEHAENRRITYKILSY